MSFHDGDRFHRAARDGYLDLLHEGNRKELNAQDEDGMTPAMWASYYGRLDALRLIVGRGGDPDKCDYYGNTPLHCAAGNGHVNCVSFLINFGVNLWALDNDFHTAKDVAALNRREDVLRLLDQAQAKHSLVNKKLVQRLKEKSIADAEKRVKNYRKLQMKAIRRAEKEEKVLERQRRKFAEYKDSPLSASSLTAFRRDSKYVYAPKFSELVLGTSDKKVRAVVSKKTSQPKKKGVEFSLDHHREDEDIDRTENGSSTMVSIESNRSDGENSSSKDSNSETLTSSNDPAVSESSTEDASSDFHHTTDSGIGDELPASETCIFDRPAFGTLSSHNSGVVPDGSETQNGHCHHQHRNGHTKDDHRSPPSSRANGEDAAGTNQRAVSRTGSKNHGVNDSIGSASSLVRRHISWEDEYEAELDEHHEDALTDESVDEDNDVEPVTLFLSALGLAEYAPLFQAEKIDLESLSLLSEEDLKTLGMPLGPRRKLEKALERRRKAFEEPGTVQDSKL